ncbi:MAG: diadenylate cyclase CdaA [Elusimicrobiota bacterium]|jgi:diadenylate cyclase|nr:diadenylate cyclase CdaA [Elusimicrobiota bacterium]
MLLLLLQILDIFFVSIIVYNIVLFIRTNRSGQIIRGIIVFMILTIVAGFLQLTILEWILRSLWTFSLIVLIIIFQPEIRKALAELGKRRWYIADINQINRDILLDTIKYFSDNKIGALIILEQNDNLKNYIENGVKINGLISKELLSTIFMPKTALHDGAVIIKNNKIASAASILPLSNAEINKSIGTRHRAGLGMAETTDALVIIVSEETGKMSFARNEKVTWDIEFQKLTEYIKRILGHKNERFIKIFFKNLKEMISIKLLKNNLKLKMISLILGAIVWYYIKNFVLK